MSGMAVAAKRYAKALFEVAKSKGTVEETQAQIAAVADAFSNNTEVKQFLDHPNIGSDAKIRAIQEAIGGKVSDYVINTLRLLIERGRGSAVSAMLDAYVSIADQELGRARAVVSSAFELSEEQMNQIALKFSALTGKKITVEPVVDPSLLGGIRVRIGDTLYDGSLSTKLSELERSFNKAR